MKDKYSNKIFYSEIPDILSCKQNAKYIIYIQNNVALQNSFVRIPEYS